MEIARLGEPALVRRLDSILSSALGPRADVLIGVGDDTALVRVDGGAHQLLTVDHLVEGVHFQRTWAPPADLGWKALAVNISDIAAMGGVPSTALVSLALPPETGVDWVDALYRGMAEAAAAYKVAIVGGDTSGAPIIVVSVTVTGVPPLALDGTPKPLLRTAARVGDALAVTGALGAAAAGLRLVHRGSSSASEASCAPAPLCRAFLRPTPRVPEGRLLVEEGVMAAIDVSDGLIADLQRLCLASGHAAEIRAPAVPVHADAASCFSQEALEMALTGGEDYEILFAAPPDVVQRVQARAELPVSVIGRIMEGPAGSVRVLDERGGELALARPGWRHF